MNGNLGELREELRPYLSDIAAAFERTNAAVFDTDHPKEQELREQLDWLDQRVGQTRVRSLAAQAEFEQCINDELAEVAGQIAEWKQSRQTSQLHSRADRCERCARIATEIALLAMDQAERAIIRALLAREEAISVQVQHIDSIRR
jgi:predicted transcriptional regulator